MCCMLNLTNLIMNNNIYYLYLKSYQQWCLASDTCIRISYSVIVSELEKKRLKNLKIQNPFRNRCRCNYFSKIIGEHLTYYTITIFAKNL